MNIDYIILHHTATAGIGDGEKEWNAISNSCQQRRGSNYLCDYHYGISPTGIVYPGMPTKSPCWHCGNDDINRRSLALACIGNFEENSMPSPQKIRLIQCVQDLKAQYPQAKIMFHKEIVPTLCPGKYYPYTEVRFERSPKQRFTDVSPTYLFNPAIEAVAKQGIMKGDSEGTFRPDEMVTRGELAQVMFNFLCKVGEL